MGGGIHCTLKTPFTGSWMILFIVFVFYFIIFYYCKLLGLKAFEKSSQWWKSGDCDSERNWATNQQAKSFQEYRAYWRWQFPYPRGRWGWCRWFWTENQVRLWSCNCKLNLPLYIILENSALHQPCHLFYVKSQDDDPVFILYSNW